MSLRTCSHTVSIDLTRNTHAHDVTVFTNFYIFCRLVHFHFKTHNFCYGYTCCLHYSGIFGPWKRRLSKTLCRPRFSLKTLRLRFSVNGPKLRLLKTMAWLPTFALCVNNNIMLIVVRAWMVMWHRLCSVDGDLKMRIVFILKHRFKMKPH